MPFFVIARGITYSEYVFGFKPVTKFIACKAVLFFHMVKHRNNIKPILQVFNIFRCELIAFQSFFKFCGSFDSRHLFNFLDSFHYFKDIYITFNDRNKLVFLNHFSQLVFQIVFNSGNVLKFTIQSVFNVLCDCRTCFLKCCRVVCKSVGFGNVIKPTNTV